MEHKARVKGNPHLVKDMRNFAILNTDKSAIAAHNIKMAELKRKHRVDEEINTLKSEMSEVKSMLSEILKAIKGEK